VEFKMDQEIAIEIIKIIPGILTIFLAIFLVVIFYRPIKNDLIPRMCSFKALGIEASFTEKIQKDVIAASEKINFQISAYASLIVAQRASRLVKLIKNPHILWVDDYPRNNTIEIKILETLGIIVDIAINTDEALRFLGKRDYDVIISDIMRNGIQDEGIRFLGEAIHLNPNNKIIFYTGNVEFERGTPPYAFGITNRPDELLHLVFDALERIKF